MGKTTTTTTSFLSSLTAISLWLLAVGVSSLAVDVIPSSSSPHSSSSSSRTGGTTCLDNMYLNSLQNSVPISSIEPDENEFERIVPEEFYGFTNPMATTWPGSKHEEYGGYLKRLDNNNNNNNENKNNRNNNNNINVKISSLSPSPQSGHDNDDNDNDEWYGSSNPMASWEGSKHPKWGGYLDNL